MGHDVGDDFSCEDGDAMTHGITIPILSYVVVMYACFLLGPIIVQ